MSPKCLTKREVEMKERAERFLEQVNARVREREARRAEARPNPHNDDRKDEA